MPGLGHKKSLSRKTDFVRMKGLEPSRDYLPLEPESSASTNSATSACLGPVEICGANIGQIF